MDQNTAIAIAVTVITFFAFTYITIQEVFKFRLKKEQIKAEAMVKCEEIKAKNQLDIETLLQRDLEYKNKHADSAVDSAIGNDDLSEQRRSRLDERA